jgi:hypothetical protein
LIQQINRIMKRNQLSNRKTTSIIGYVILLSIALLCLSTLCKGQEIVNPNPFYFGYTIALTSEAHTIQSNIRELDGLAIRKEGGNAGVSIGNRQMRFRSGIGLQYSAPSSRISTDVWDFSSAGSLYLLRLKNIKTHLLEPYVIGGASLQQARLYGELKEDHVIANDAKILTRIERLQGFVGLGLEYQLENDCGDFFQFFAECRYGKVFSERTSSSVMTGTKSTYSTAVSVGIVFGRIR